MRRSRGAGGVFRTGLALLVLAAGCGPDAPPVTSTVRPIGAPPEQAAEPDPVEDLLAALEAEDEPAAEAEPTSASGADGTPRVAGLQIRPAERINGSEVVARAQVVDPDGDEVTVEYAWFVNDEQVEATGPVFSSFGLSRGDRVRVRAIASDGSSESEPVYGPWLTVDNGPPRIVSQPLGPDADGVFRYQVLAEDPEGDRGLRFRLAKAPPGMTISSVGGSLEWRPGVGETGVFPVEIVVQDSGGASAVQRFELTLEPPPAAPAR
jgi:hypothetical protein